jgi:endonuclease-3
VVSVVSNNAEATGEQRRGITGVARSTKKPTSAAAAEVVSFLKREYANAECALHFRSPFQLLIATILSAQCTDERVNMVTKELFARCPTAKEMAAISLDELERIIQSTGFFRNKAKNILACSQRLVEEFGGNVPKSLDVLVTLPGVGRKTANVVLGTAFGIPSGVVVDTHVSRLSNRMGLTRQSDPVKIEQDLMALLPEQEWIDFSHRMIHHGRRICTARKPDCEQCGLRDVCPKIGVAPPAGKAKPKAASSTSSPRRTSKAAKP